MADFVLDLRREGELAAQARGPRDPLAFGQGADECINADDLGMGTTSAPFDTTTCSDTGTFATSGAQNQCASLTEDVWFKWTASGSGSAIFSTCNNATFDTEIAVWEGSDCAAMMWLACNAAFDPDTGWFIGGRFLSEQ